MTKNKVFLFDMDGVIVNSEKIWQAKELKYYTSILNANKAKLLLKKAYGSDLNSIFNWAKEYGYKGTKNQFIKRYDQQAQEIYATAPITPNLKKLVNYLTNNQYKLGIVSSSRRIWIQKVLARLPFANQFSVTVSVNDTPQLKSKPHPDGYLYAIKKLNANPQTSYILEDSQTGINAAKASKITTICLTQNLPNNYQPTNADYYIDNLLHLISFLKKADIST